MIQSRPAILMALILPILALAGLTAYKKYNLEVGRKVVLPIIGYDPRDLLSGHYLIFRVDYGIKNLCRSNINPQNTSRASNDNRVGFVCLDPKGFSFRSPTSCDSYIRGLCKRGRFEAGIERYYIPQEDAKYLDKVVRKGQASIEVSIGERGNAQIKDLLIDGESWRAQK
jgi:uncharacterized membrane-anchored protein